MIIWVDAHLSPTIVTWISQIQNHGKSEPKKIVGAIAPHKLP